MTSPFELLRFEATPVTPAVAVVELAGVFAGQEPTRPRLLVETGGVSREMPALSVSGSPWSAVFAVPLPALSEPAATFSLVPGRGPLIALPAPSDSGGDDDRFVRLARTANDLRHRLGEATETAAAAAERLAAVSDERAALAEELDAARAALAAAEARAAESHDAAVAAREEQARAEGEADIARAEAERTVAEVRASAEQEVAHARAAAEQEVAEARATAEREIAEVRGAAEQEVAEARATAEREVAETRSAVADELAGLRAAAEEAQAQLADLEERAIAAEDDARAARLDLRDARARVESLMREHRTARIAAARTHVAAASSTEEFRAARLGPDWAEGSEDEEAPNSSDVSDSPDDSSDDAVPGSSGSEEEGLDGAGEPSDAVPGSSGTEDERLDAGAPRTQPLVDERPAAPELDDTAQLTAVNSPSLWRDDERESVRILRPRTRAGRIRPARVVDDVAPRGEVLEPAAVGARLMQPAELSPRRRAVAIVTNPRVIVGGIFALLIIALVLIFNGVGLV